MVVRWAMCAVGAMWFTHTNNTYLKIMGFHYSHYTVEWQSQIFPRSSFCRLIVAPSLLTFPSFSLGLAEVPSPLSGLCEIIILYWEITVCSLQAVCSLHLLKKDIAVIQGDSFSAHAKSKGKPWRQGLVSVKPDERNKRKNRLTCLCGLLRFKKRRFLITIWVKEEPAWSRELFPALMLVFCGRRIDWKPDFTDLACSEIIQ